MTVALGILLGTSAAFAVGDWLAVATGRRWLELLCKPGVLACLTLWFALREPVASYPAGMAFAVGLAFSLLGDIALMVREEYLKQGLAAFAMAQLSYIYALNQDGWVPGLVSVSLLILFAILAAALLRLLLPALSKADRAGLRLPVAAYAIVLTVTAWSAVGTTLRPDWTTGSSVWMAAGGILFFLSDSALAINRFLRPLPAGRLMEHATYHLAQFSLALGMALHLP